MQSEMKTETYATLVKLVQCPYLLYTDVRNALTLYTYFEATAYGFAMQLFVFNILLEHMRIQLPLYNILLRVKILIVLI